MVSFCEKWGLPKGDWLEGKILILVWGLVELGVMSGYPSGDIGDIN